jgi:putative chitobiose transport system permease protein
MTPLASPESPSSPSRGRTWRSQLTPYLFLLPAMTVLGIAVFWPALQAFYISFTEYGYDITAAPEFVGLKNFQRLWADPVFWQTLRNTLLYLICVVPVLVFMPLVLAILVNQKLKGMTWFRTAYYTPVVISMVVAGIAWKWLYTENGFLNQWLKVAYQPLQQSYDAIAPIMSHFPGWEQLGAGLLLLKSGVPWLTSPNLALFSIMAVTIWKGLGYYMVIYLAGLQGIPADLYEAAAIDGSQGWQKHWDITLPLMAPYLLLVAVISAISATKVFEEIFIMTQGGPLNHSKTIVYYLYEQAFGDNLDISYASAIGLILFLGIFGLSICNILLRRVLGK